MKIDDVRARDGFDRLLGWRLAVAGARRRRARAETRARQSSPAAPSPDSARRAAARAAARAPPEETSSSPACPRGCRVSPQTLPVVLTKLIDPLSLPTPTETFVPSSCRAFDSSSPLRVFVPSFIIAAARLRDAASIRRLELIGAAEERDGERHERKVVLLRTRSARRRWTSFDLVQVGTRSSGSLADRRLLGAIESSLSLRQPAEGQRAERIDEQRADEKRCGVSLDSLCFLPASMPGRSGPSARRSARRGRASDICWRRAARRPASPPASSDTRCGSIRGRHGWRRRSRAETPCRGSTRGRARTTALRRPSPSALPRRSDLRA